MHPDLEEELDLLDKAVADLCILVSEAYKEGFREGVTSYLGSDEDTYWEESGACRRLLEITGNDV